MWWKYFDQPANISWLIEDLCPLVKNWPFFHRLEKFCCQQSCEQDWWQQWWWQFQVWEHSISDSKIIDKILVLEGSRCSHRRVLPIFVFVWAKLLSSRTSILTTAPSSLMISYQFWISNRWEKSVWRSTGEWFLFCGNLIWLTPGFVQEENKSRR